MDITSDTPSPTEGPVQYWLAEINAARRREKDFRKNGQTVLDIYSGKKVKTTPFNILFSNTETIFPALYSNIPRPVVDRRFRDEDPIGKASAMASTRLLEYSVDTNIDGYDTFDDGMKAAVLAGLLPGRGVVAVKYDSEEGMYPPAAGQTEGTPYKKNELVCVDIKEWDKVYFGFARKWSKVPWIAYEEHIDEKEAVRLFGKEKAALIKFTKEMDEDSDREDKGDHDDQGARKVACIYQIWDKDGDRKVRYVSPQYPDDYLLVEDDPLGLTGFFNTPKPLEFIERLSDLRPVALYELYRNQATELNRITTRLNKVVEAIKAKAVYDTELGEDIKHLLEADDNAFVPADKGSSLAAEKGLQNAIWFMPLEQLVNVADKLILAREQCKQVIYEIMGIADILRGASKASETLGAQKIKTEWGSLRLRPKQKEVQRYARDMLRLMLEVAATKFSEKTWAGMTGLPFLTTEQRAQAEQVMAQIQIAAQQMQAAGVQPSPQQVQQMQQTQAALAKPVWGKVLEMLQDDIQRSYRVDIETNSTVEPQAVEDQKNIAEVMTALGQFLNGVTPLVTSGALPFSAAQAMMLAIVRRFRFGPEIEDQIKAMQAPKMPDDGKEQKAQQQMADQKMKFDQEKTQGLGEIERLKAEVQMEKLGRALDKRLADIELRELKVEVAEDRLNLSAQVASERLGTQDKVMKINQSSNDKVRSIQDAAAKREQSEAQKAVQAVESQVEGLQAALDQLTQSLEAIGSREVVNAERIKGPDGRLSGVRKTYSDGKVAEISIK